MLYKLVRQGYVQLRVLNIKDAGDRLRFRAACFLALMKYAGQPWKPPKIMPQHSEPLQKMLRDAGTDTDQIDAIADLASQTDQVEEIGRLASQTMGDYTTLAKAVLQRLSQGASGSEPSTPKAF